MPAIDAEGLLKSLGRVTLLDARAGDRFRGEVEPLDPVAGHIPALALLPNDQNLRGRTGASAPPRRNCARTFEAFGVPPAQVVHQCGSGVTACHNLLAMEIAGLSGSVLYPGSWSEWCSDPSRPVAVG